ncbi:spore-associated protein A [Kitasatospora sp. NPDC056783]|uniref:spore-associated protein A n=1 Tax=Kitasatospora sp. NPDC056783 TaxID=3345943 RepID=UPI0036C6CB27
MMVKNFLPTRFRQMGRQVATAVGLLGISAASIVAIPGTASAQEAAYNGVCGSGYNVKGWADVYSRGGSLAATVYLTYSAATGYNCVVTIKKHATTYLIGAFLSNDNVPDSWVSDWGNYMQYAGPVYVYARGACVSWGGAYEDSEVNRNHTNCGSIAPAGPSR